MKINKRVALVLRFFAIANSLEAEAAVLPLVFFTPILIQTYHKHRLGTMILCLSSPPPSFFFNFFFPPSFHNKQSPFYNIIASSKING